MAYDQYFERPLEVVEEQIAAMTGRASEALTRTYAATAALSNIPSPSAGIMPPAPVLPTDDGTLTLPTAPTAPTSLTIDSLIMPGFTDGADLTAGLDDSEVLPTFVSPIDGFNIPTAPSPIDLSGLPTPPGINDVAIPDAPTLPTPELGDLLQIVIPTFAGLNLPTFNALPPEFTKIEPASFAWADMTYTSDNLDAVKAVVARVLQGGTGIPPEIETALFERSADRLDMDTMAARQEAVDTWSGRNFDMPPGMLVEQANAAREAAQLQKNTAVRDVLVQAATWEIENLRFAVQQGIALEGLTIGMFNEMAGRALQAANYRVQADVALYNSAVAVFQAEYTGYGIKAQVYEAEIRGELAKLEAFKAQIEAQQAIGQVNEQTVRIYLARLQGVTNMIELYKARVGGAQAYIDAQKAKVEMYGQGVQAYAARVQADKTRFEAYASQIQGEVAKGQLVDAAARAFASTIDGYRAKNEIKVSRVNARIAALQAGTQRFVAEVGAERDRVASAAESVRTRLAVFQEQVAIYTASSDVKIKERGLQIQKYETALRTALAYYEVVIKEYDAQMARLEQESEVRVKALETIAQVGSQIAGGAFAAMHVSAGMDGRASASSDVQEVHRFDNA